MKIFFVCKLSNGVSIFHLIGQSEFTDTYRQMDLDHYILIDTIAEDLEKCIKSIDWVCKHTINKTILHLITLNNETH